MISEKYTDLINRDIDGLTSPEEQAELRRFLDSSSEGRACYNQLVQMNARLQAISPAEPPVGLTQAIMSQIPERQRVIRPIRSTQPGLPEFMRAIFTPSHGVVLAAGAVAGALVMMFAGPANHLLPGQVGGTFLPVESGTSTVIDSRSLSEGSASAAAEVKREGENLVLSIQSEAPDGAKLEIRFDPSDIILAKLSDTQAERLEVSAFDGTIFGELRGEHSIRLVFLDSEPTGSQIRVILSQNGAKSTVDLRTTLLDQEN